MTWEDKLKSDPKKSDTYWNGLLLKNPQFLPNLYETCSKWPAGEFSILTKSDTNWGKNCGFFYTSIFQHVSDFFLNQTLDMILSVWIELSVFPHTSMVIKIRNNNSGVSTICIIIVLVLRQFYDCGMREARCQLYWRSRWHVSIKIHTCDLGRGLTI